MNLSRLALAAVAAWIVDSIYGFCVYGESARKRIRQIPGRLPAHGRRERQSPLMFVGSLLAFFALAYIFAKGHEGGNGLAEGLRFGFVIAVFEFGAMSIGNYAVMNIGRKIAVEMAVAGFVEALIAGASSWAWCTSRRRWPRRRAREAVMIEDYDHGVIGQGGAQSGA